MADTVRPDGAPQAAPRIDWEGIEGSPEFRELVAKKRSFVVPATIFYLAFYTGFILLCSYAPDFMGESVYEGLTVGYCLALTQFAMVLVLGIMYLHKANHSYDPMADRVVQMAARSDLTSAPAEPAGRFAPDETDASTKETTS